MRHPGQLHVPPEACLDHAPTVLADLRLQVVTPMFGGGSTPGTSDADWPIRPSAIRGHLRFWWRTCNARRFTSAAKMYEEESQLWGAAAMKGSPQYGSSPVDIKIQLHADGIPTGTNNTPRLATFPFADMENPGRRGVTFSIRLTISPFATTSLSNVELVHAVKQALWGWITFGGVGARTRRGCGSLQLVANGAIDQTALSLPDTIFQPNEQDVTGWLTKKHDELVNRDADGNVIKVTSGLPLVPSLWGARVQSKLAANDANQAWKQAVDPMQEFRQGQNTGRNPGSADPRRPGQSRWPEPGAVREIGNIPAAGYTRTAGGNGREFPRADLGLPILFQNMRGHNDPAPTLEGELDGAQRMASPIILKALAAGNTSYLPIALLLNAPHVWDAGTPGVQLDDRYRHTTTPLAVSAMSSPGREPRWPFPGNEPPRTANNASARDAFMDFLERDRNWTKVLP